MTTTANKRFADYIADNNQLSRQQAEGIAVQEVGQEWDFLLTLRLSNTTSSTTLVPTMSDSALIQHIDRYFANLTTRPSDRVIYRSVYLHKLGDEYHSHIFSKYPLSTSRSGWDAKLRSEWLKLPLLQGANPSSDICFHQQHKQHDSLEWGIYGIKGNGAQTAWILDSSKPFRNLNQAYKRGNRRLRRLGEDLSRLPSDFAAHSSLSRSRSTSH